MSQCCGQITKLLWADAVTTLADQLADESRHCPHGHDKHAQCDRCRLLFQLAECVREWATAEANRTNAEYAVAPSDGDADELSIEEQVRLNAGLCLAWNCKKSAKTTGYCDEHCKGLVETSWDRR